MVPMKSRLGSSHWQVLNEPLFRGFPPRENQDTARVYSQTEFAMIFDLTTKPLKCLGDYIRSGGHSGEERVETNQSIAVNPDFHRMAVRFLCDDREMESDLPQKSMVLWLGSKMVANSARQHAGAVGGFRIGWKPRSLGMN
jgi:hypothetical protein